MTPQVQSTTVLPTAYTTYAAYTQNQNYFLFFRGKNENSEKRKMFDSFKNLQSNFGFWKHFDSLGYFFANWTLFHFTRTLRMGSIVTPEAFKVKLFESL